MPKNFKIHDRVSWNSEAGRVSGTITRVHTREFKVKGYTHHASPDDPQYEIRSGKTDHIAFHKASALARRRSAGFDRDWFDAEPRDLQRAGMVR